MYKPIDINRKQLTMMGVLFPDLETFDSAVNAIGSNMFEGFEPTASRIALIRDYIMDKITSVQFIRAAKDNAMSND